MRWVCGERVCEEQQCFGVEFFASSRILTFVVFRGILVWECVQMTHMSAQSNGGKSALNTSEVSLSIIARDSSAMMRVVK